MISKGPSRHSGNRTRAKNPSSTNSPLSGFLNSASDVAVDLLELAELQVKLFRSDLSQTFTRAMLPIAFLFCGIVVGIAALPAITIGLSQAIAIYTDWPQWTILVVAGLSLMLISVITISIALWSLRNVLNQLEPTKIELAKNVAWLKKMMRQHD